MTCAQVIPFEVEGRSGGEKAGQRYQVFVEGFVNRPDVRIVRYPDGSPRFELVALAVWNTRARRLEAVEATGEPPDQRLIGFWEFLVESALEV